MEDDVLPVESQVSPERRVRQSSAARHLLARHVLSYAIFGSCWPGLGLEVPTTSHMPGPTATYRLQCLDLVVKRGE
jgi:hypothetical protein